MGKCTPCNIGHRDFILGGPRCGQSAIFSATRPGTGSFLASRAVAALSCDSFRCIAIADPRLGPKYIWLTVIPFSAPRHSTPESRKATLFVQDAGINAYINSGSGRISAQYPTI